MYHSLHLLYIIADEFSRYINKKQEMDGSPSISSLSENMWMHRTNFCQQWNN